MTRCKICRVEFERTRMSQPTCGDPVCRAEWKRQCAIKKAERLEIRKRKEKLKSLDDWMKDAQAAVNSFVRERDAFLPCISCGITNPVQWHAGHYLSRGAHPELALDPRNINRQCSQCNDYLSGNQIEYRKGLIRRYGQAYVDWLEGQHDAARLSVDDLKRITAEFKKATKELREQRERIAA